MGLFASNHCAIAGSVDQDQSAQNVLSDSDLRYFLWLFFHGEKEVKIEFDIWKNMSLIIRMFISCFPVGYREISVKIFFDLTLVAPVKIPIFMFLLPRLIARASQPHGNMTSFTLHFWRNIVVRGYAEGGTPLGITEKKCTGF